MKTTNVSELVSRLKSADDAYYNSSEPLISDEEYDFLKDSLSQIDPENDYLKKIGAPVSRDTPWEKAKHKISMCSLNKCNTEDEFIKWCNETGVDGVINTFVLQEKLDGLSINLEYENGTLKRAISRGDGVLGEDIFENVIRMNNVKKELKENFTGSLRGEIILRLFEFEKLCTIQDFKNPRNAASGICKRHDHLFSDYLTVLYYDAQSIKNNFESEKAKIDFIEENELEPVMNYVVSTKDAIKVYNEYIESKRSSISWDIDGLVCKVNDLKKQKFLGELGGNPAGQIAWKFPPIKRETKIIDVEWQIGRSGKITPVAILEPIQIGGITVKRSSLYNVDNFKNFSFNKGDTVVVSRQNDVIPCVLEITKKSSGSKLEYIDKCPSCGSKTKIDGKFLICDNEDCIGAALGSIMKWIVKTGIQKLGVGEKTIEALFDAGLIKTPVDLYRLKKEDVLKLDRQGERSSQKLIDIIQSKKELDLATFLGALNIKDFSTSMFEKLIEAGYDSLDKILVFASQCNTFGLDELENIPGVGPKKTRALFLGMKKKTGLINDLLRVISVKDATKKKEDRKMSGKLTGQSFCFTGKIEKVDENGERYTRNRMHELVIENGGDVIDSVKSGLSFLVLADPNSQSTKTQKAKKLGVVLMSEKDFFKILEQ